MLVRSLIQYALTLGVVYIQITQSDSVEQYHVSTGWRSNQVFVQDIRATEGFARLNNVL